ncbi:alpha/beta fold hydrolase [Clostridium sp. Cult2]|uniref:alpha/beta fold hydrolase n=1 Tax=Clostridium sp. Cult2 TaxID=2079003 RepID=UPI001F2A0C5D|nr:alpha/beta hydrolase [Clostridium sp. Cult2]MCF6466137.1 alpha/beta hydrolase [Clostridium sp. Cult2]
MPYITINNKKIYYKEYGHGEPIVFLNGVMMSTNSWSPFIRTISKDYRMIVVDLIDQGKSDSHEEEYTVETQADFLKEFLDKLKLENIHLLGMSYGGKVALTFTLKYEYKVKTLMLSNTDSYTTKIMNDIGKAWIYAASTLDGNIFSSIALPYMYSYNYYEINYEDIKEKARILSKILDEKWYGRFKRSLDSARDFNVSHIIKNIKVPTLIISSELDIITPIKYQQLIHQKIENSKWIIIEGVGHASMFEKPEDYISIIMDFMKE